MVANNYRTPELDMHESKHLLPGQFVHSDIARRVFGNSMQASYFERFHWSILNFWTLQTAEHAVPYSVAVMLHGM